MNENAEKPRDPRRGFRNADDTKESEQTRERVAAKRARDAWRQLEYEGYEPEDLEAIVKDEYEWPSVVRLPKKPQPYMDNITAADLPPGKKLAESILKNLRPKKSAAKKTKK